MINNFRLRPPGSVLCYWATRLFFCAAHVPHRIQSPIDIGRGFILSVVERDPFFNMSTVPVKSATLSYWQPCVWEPAAHQSAERVAGLRPDFTVPVRYFDYGKWDKVTKPAEFNMKIPKHLHEEAAKQSMAAKLAVRVNTPIYNGRVVEDITLDSTGFSFGHAPTTMEGQDFYDIHTVHTKYFPEVIEHIKCLTGATAVLPFDHSVRNSTLMRDGTGIETRRFALDNTYWSGPNRARQLLKDGIVDEVLVSLCHNELLAPLGRWE